MDLNDPAAFAQELYYKVAFEQDDGGDLSTPAASGSPARSGGTPPSPGRSRTAWSSAARPPPA